MSRLPSLTGRQLVTVLRWADLVVIGQKGKHAFLQHSNDRRTVVPLHADEIIDPVLLRKIIRDVEMSRDEFMELTVKRKGYASGRREKQ